MKPKPNKQRLNIRKTTQKLDRWISNIKNLDKLFLIEKRQKRVK